MNRLTLATAVALLLLMAGAATGQPIHDAPKVGWVSAGTEARDLSLKAFRKNMRALGWIDGRSVVIEPRWAAGAPDRLEALVRELVELEVDVIVTPGTAFAGARRVVAATPIVFGISADPVVAGLIDSLARPGGRFTGVTFLSYEMNEKRLELLSEAFPNATRVALLSNPDHAGEHLELAASRTAARRLGLELRNIHLRTAGDLAPAFEAIRRMNVQAVVLIPDAFLSQHRAPIIDFATREGLPVLAGWSNYARSGAVITYGPSLRASFGRLAHYVDRILRGARPAELPVELPTTFELVVNLKAARTLGITVPPAILLRATEVIE